MTDSFDSAMERLKMATENAAALQATRAEFTGKVKKQLQAIQPLVDKLIARLKELEQTRATMQDQYASNESKQSKCSQDLAELQAKYNELEKAYRDSTDKINKHEAAIQEKDQELEALAQKQTEIENSNLTHEQKDKQIADLQAKASELQQTIDQSEKTMAEHQQAKDAQASALAQHQETAAQLTQELETAKSQNEQLQQQIDAAQQALAAAENALNQLANLEPNDASQREITTLLEKIIQSLQVDPLKSLPQNIPNVPNVTNVPNVDVPKDGIEQRKALLDDYISQTKLGNIGVDGLLTKLTQKATVPGSSYDFNEYRTQINGFVQGQPNAVSEEGVKELIQMIATSGILNGQKKGLNGQKGGGRNTHKRRNTPKKTNKKTHKKQTHKKIRKHTKPYHGGFIYSPATHKSIKTLKKGSMSHK